MLKDSVSPAMIQRRTKPYQCQVAKMVLRKGMLIRVRSRGFSGTRDTARAFSLGVRYGARVVVGVSGKRKKP